MWSARLRPAPQFIETIASPVHKCPQECGHGRLRVRATSRQSSCSRLHHREESADVQIAVEFRCLPFRQRSGVSPCLNLKLIDALPVCLRKLHRQKIPGDTGCDGAFAGLAHAGQNRRFRIRYDDLRIHICQQLSPTPSAQRRRPAIDFVQRRPLDWARSP